MGLHIIGNAGAFVEAASGTCPAMAPRGRNRVSWKEETATSAPMHATRRLEVLEVKVQVYPAVGTLPEELPGKWQPVVIDTLRATTVIATALAAGARAVEPSRTPDEVDAAHGRRLGETPEPLRAGERGGLRIPGFDLGNSPGEYRPEVVRGRTLCFTTSNGTMALHEASLLGDVICAALVNRAAVARELTQRRDDVVILCAGTAGRFSADDVATAGSLVAELRRLVPMLEVDDLGMVAEHWFLSHETDLPGMLRQTVHGRRLVALGFDDDLDACGVLDALAVVPIYQDGRVALQAGVA